MGKHHTAPTLLALFAPGVLVLLCVLASMPASAASRSEFSRWLGEITPEIRTQLSAHPRFSGRPVRLQPVEHNGLTQAVVTLLTRNLQDREGIVLVGRELPVVGPAAVPARIDDLLCTPPEQRKLRLLVSVIETGRGRGRVQLSLVEPGEAEPTPHTWNWQGALSSTEGKLLATAVVGARADGSLQAPWGEGDVESAARDLHRQLACALRPQLATRLELRWFDTTSLAPLLADTAHHSRHLLGSYVELGFTEESPDFRVDAELVPFQAGVWQLWLHGVPQSADLAPVQAVAYFRSAPGAALKPAPLVGQAPPHAQPPAELGPARDYLAVEMIDAHQAKAGRGRAELQVQLRLENRADWPIEFAFSLSGGHYEHCIARPGYYRHDEYGQLRGRLEAGESLVRYLVIDGAEHRPNPWMGPRKCAGFRSLEGFQDFSAKGYTVTDYVRWDS